MDVLLPSTEILSAFPQAFDFYGIGTVQPVELSLDEVNEEEIEAAMAIRLFGDTTAWIVLLMEKGLDPSVGSEVGNILCSKIATELGSSASLDVMISPPSPLNRAQIATALRYLRSAIRREYGFCIKDVIIPITVLVFSHPPKEFGHV